MAFLPTQSEKCETKSQQRYRSRFGYLRCYGRRPGIAELHVARLIGMQCVKISVDVFITE